MERAAYGASGLELIERGSHDCDVIIEKSMDVQQAVLL
jgi:hypothetical protein